MPLLIIFSFAVSRKFILQTSVRCLISNQLRTTFSEKSENSRQICHIICWLINSYLKDFVASMTSFNFDFLDRQQQIIHQHIGTLSVQDLQKLKQMSSAETRQYLSQRNLLITNTNSFENIITNTMQIQHTSKGKYYFDKKDEVCIGFFMLILIIIFFLHSL